MLPSDLPFRIGTTSYIIPDDILPNVRYLSDKVQDIQLVLFEMEDSKNNLPDVGQVGELQVLARKFGLSYTVHLPLDMRLGADGENLHISLTKARKVIESTRELHPLAYIVHLDGKDERHSTDPDVVAHWQHQAAESLRLAAHWTGDIKLLAVENLENYPYGFNDPVIATSGSSRCIDIGHLWLDGHNPVDFFPGRLEQTTVIHLHGIGERDHQSLALMPVQAIDHLIRALLEYPFRGVLTLEVFSEEDLNSSLQAVLESHKRIKGQ